MSQSEVPSQSRGPRASIIVPVHDGEDYLPASLGALQCSDLPRAQWELIVVDDSSHDRSAEIAASYADRVISTPDGPRGPAGARNCGAAVARGEILVFVDSDVCVHRDTLRRLVERLESQPELSAIFGSYDSEPTAQGLVTQYRNLLHHYVHQRDAGEAVTFWAGCGAIRAGVFVSCGGFDEVEYAQSSIEDIQLGYRMSALNHRIVLSPEIQGTHLKRWTLWGMIVTDVSRRGIPWVRLLLSQRVRSPATLNLRPAEQVSTVLVVVACLTLIGWSATGDGTWLTACLAALAAMLVLNAPLLAWFARQRGVWFALRVVPLRVLYYAGNAVSLVIGTLGGRGWANVGRLATSRDDDLERRPPCLLSPATRPTRRASDSTESMV